MRTHALQGSSNEPLSPGHAENPSSNRDRSLSPTAPRSNDRPQGDVRLSGLVRSPQRDAAIEASLRKHNAGRQPMSREMLPIASYSLAHKVGGGRATQDDFDRLAFANRAVNSARKTLVHGRGNVHADNRGDQSKSEVRAAAAQYLELELRHMGFQRGPNPIASTYATLAMAAKVFEAGVCDNFASVAALSYGQQAKDAGRRPNDQVRMVSHDVEKHTWAEVDGPDSEAGPVVMDPWSEGHAVFAEDSRFGKDRGHVQTHTSFDIESAAEYHEWTEEFAAGYRSQTWQRLDHAEQALEQMPPRNHPISQPVLEDAFAGRVHARLQAAEPWASVVTEVRAAGLAAAFGSRGVPSLVADAKTIVQETAKLVTPRRTSDPT